MSNPLSPTYSRDEEVTDVERVPLFEPPALTCASYLHIADWLGTLDASEMHTDLYDIRPQMVERLRQAAECPESPQSRALLVGLKLLIYRPFGLSKNALSTTKRSTRVR